MGRSFSPAVEEAIYLKRKKDNEVVGGLENVLVDSLEEIWRPRVVSQYAAEIKLLTKVAYFLINTFRVGGQSLGEEFSSIIRIQRFRKGNLSIILAIAIHFVLYVTEKLPSKMSRNAKRLLELVSSIHLLYFFLTGRFVSPFKYTSPQKSSSSPAFRLAGVFMSIEFGFNFINYIISLRNSGELAVREPLYVGRDGKSCGVCFTSPIEDPAAGKCGHVFCFSCLLGSAMSKQECPICRKPITAEDVKPIYY